MYIHEKIMLCALDLLNEYHLETIDVVGELCQAGFALSAFNDAGIFKLHKELTAKFEALGDGVIESRDSVQTGQTGNAQAKPENSDMDSACHDIAPSPNVKLRG